jgi:hypothetical protein
MCSHESLFGVLCLSRLAAAPLQRVLFSTTTTDSTMREHFIEIIKNCFVNSTGLFVRWISFSFSTQKKKRKKNARWEANDGEKRRREETLHTKDLMAEEKWNSKSRALRVVINEKLEAFHANFHPSLTPEPALARAINHNQMQIA